MDNNMFLLIERERIKLLLLLIGVGTSAPIWGQSIPPMAPPPISQVGPDMGSSASNQEELPPWLEDPAKAAATRGVFGKCLHVWGQDVIPGPIGPKWENPRDGEQIFFNRFDNATSMPQTFAQEIAREVQTSYLGSLTISVVCAEVGIEVVVKLKRTYPVNVPAHRAVEMSAYANLMDRRLEELVRCADCREVLDVHPTVVTGARGINEKFKTVRLN